MKKAAHTVVPKRCSLYKQARSDKWYARIKLDSGEWYRVSTEVEDLESATERALSLYYESKVKSNNKLPQNTRTLRSVAKNIVSQLEAKSDTAEWKQIYKHYIQVINKYQIPFFANTKLDNIKSRYEGYIAFVGEQIGRIPKASTLNTHHAALKLILTEAVNRGWCASDQLPVLKNSGKETQRRPTFDITEYRSLIKKLAHWCKQPSHRKKDSEIKLMLYDYVLILANSGIRHGREAMEIKWANISFAKSSSGNEIVTMNVIKRKGRKGTEERRDVVVRHNDISDVKKVLERLKERNPKLQGKSLEAVIKGRHDLPLFALSDGSQPKRLDGTFKKFLADAELSIGAEQSQRTLYSFRHFYASQQLLANPPITVYLLAKQLGTSVKMIEKHYGHFEALQKADSLSGWLK
jgi:hypothetical protein